jgi:trimeric autotransporter adhesin
MKYTFTALLLFGTLLAHAQQQLPTTPASDLQQLESKFNQRFQTEKLKAETLATQQNTTLRFTNNDGSVVEFSRFDASGQMMFNKTDNIGSGRTISTNKVWPGGTVGTALTGANMPNRLGEWDGGAVRLTHQEFGGRVVQADGATNIIDHATHVAGTMIASGVSANAQGMSYAATLKAYDWNNDESEMSSAASAGMLLSNHSYGTVTGWYFNENLSRWEWYGDPSISATQDWKFGFYDQQAADWDNIAFNAPYYLICKSAGNDRGDNLQGSTHFVRNSNGIWVQSTSTRNIDGNTLGYDCIPTNGTSKNILTVGAVNKIGSSNNNNGYVNAAGVVMSSFSGWGPTDDGRIKPDVVAAGVNLYSSFSNADNDYSSISGTSMASPSVTGSLLLVQQHYNNLNAKFMRSASLKALMIHTADEAGTTAGPDYKFGWGLLNTAKAVQFITDSNYNQIQERVLANGTTYNQGFAVDGNSPLRVTICWTEKPGTPVGAALNPTNRMLVNDLDIRITRNSDNTVFLPWILDPANPQASATTGDNTRDNVEQILILAPSAGTYTVSVSHKGTLSGGSSQSYSLIIGGIIGKPAAAFSNTVTTICSAKTITFSDNSGGNPTSRVWYFPGGIPSTSSASSVVVTYNTPGNFPVSLKIANSIGSDSVYYKDYVKVGGLKLPFLETFEGNSTSLKDWTIGNGVNNTDTDTTKWRLATVSGNTPGNMAYCMPSFYYTSSNKKDLLYSPPLNFYGFQNVVLSFNHAYATKNGRNDSLRIYISTNCGTTWTPLTTNDSIQRTSPQQNLTSFVPANANDWCLNCYSINLGAYDGQSNLKLRFETTSSFGNNVYIDNISITGDALTPAASFGTANTTVCAGNPVYFADSSTNNPTKWRWSFSGAQQVTDSNQNPTVVWNTPGTYNVKLVVTNAGGADSLTKVSYITVLPSPNKPNILQAANGMCIGDSVLLSTDSADNGFVWYRDNIAIQTATTAQYHALLAGTYRIALVGSNGCSTTSVNVPLVSGSKPDVPAITSNIVGTAFCDGGTATLTSSATSGNQWYKNAIALTGETNKTLAAKDAGAYYVATTQSGCKSDPSNTLTYTLKPKPITSAITGNANAKFNTSEVYSVTATAGSSYTWTVTNGTPSNASSSVTVVWSTSPNGNVAVKETASNGCIGDVQNLDITLTPNTALKQLDFLSSLTVYPNPMNDVLNLTFNKGTSHTTTIRIINMIGQTVASEVVNTIPSGYLHQLNVSKLTAGV